MSWKRTLYILVFVQFVSAVGMSSIIPFLPLYIEELGSSAGLSVELLAGLVFSVQAFVMMLAAPIWGALADRYGRKVMVVRATLGSSVVILLMAFARSGEELVLLRGMQGLVTGIFSALMALVAASVPRNRTGYALSLLQVGLWGGVSMGPFIGGIVADTLGFQAAFFVTAGLLVVAGLLVLWGVEETFEPIPSVSGEQVGFMTAWQQVLSISGVRLTYMARFLSRLGRTMIAPFIPLLVQQLIGDTNSAASTTGIIIGVSAMAGTVSALYLGRLGDRINRRMILMGAALVAGLVYLPTMLVTSVWQFAILFVLAGAATGGAFPIFSALLASYTEPGQEGAVYGLESSIMAAARAIAPMVGAVLVSIAGLRSVYGVAGLLLLSMALVAGRWLPDPSTLLRQGRR